MGRLKALQKRTALTTCSNAMKALTLVQEMCLDGVAHSELLMPSRNCTFYFMRCQPQRLPQKGVLLYFCTHQCLDAMLACTLRLLEPTILSRAPLERQYKEAFSMEGVHQKGQKVLTSASERQECAPGLTALQGMATKPTVVQSKRPKHTAAPGAAQLPATSPAGEIGRDI